MPCCRKGKERKRVDGVWGPWSHFSYETTVPASLEIRGISLVSPPAAAERVPGVPVPGSAAAPSSVPDPLKPGRMGAIP